MQTQGDKQLSDEQSREIAETIREELARRRISRQALAEQAKLSLSTLEKVLGGRRPFTLATTVRLEQALGVSLRKSVVVVTPAAANDVAPDSLGSYAHRAVTWLEDVYITLRPSFGDKDAIFAYRTEILWEPKVSSLVFREGDRTDAAYEHTGEVHLDAPRRSRLAADADCSTDRLRAAQERSDAVLGTGRVRRRQL